MATTTKVIRVANPPRRRTGRGKHRIRTARKRNAGRARRHMTEKQIRHFGTKAQRAALKRKYRARFKKLAAPSGRGRRRKNTSSSSPRVKTVYRYKTKARASRRRTSRRRSSNPALVVTLGSINPRRRSKSVAKTRKRRRNRRASNARRHHTRRRRNNRTRVVVVSAPRRHNRRRRHNAGSHHRRRHHRRMNRRRNPLGGGGKQMVMAGVGILAGVAATKYIVNVIPASISSSLGTGGIMAVVISGASAFVAGWVLKKVDPTVGEFALYGGIAQTISVALNQFFPSVGGVLSLGDLVNGNFVVPQNPIRAGMAVPAIAAPTARGMSAYPSAY